ncbi:MAG: patatin-like phospholipase family protein [Acidobacteriota bacterium]|nr:patatin-like phospholipase family protein [Blastocatellia bacterium]MDW8413788.1 patatin-like phospholipase family protein [Acidobacteriota bacterium]
MAKKISLAWNNQTTAPKTARKKAGLIYLALAGGGVGALGFEIGGLCALERVLNPKGQKGHKAMLNELISGYQGVSAGSIVSSLMAVGFSPHTIRDVMLERSTAFPTLNRSVLGTQPQVYFSLGENLVRSLLRTVRAVIGGLASLDLPFIWPFGLRKSHRDDLFSLPDWKLLGQIVRLGALEQASVNNFIHNLLDTIPGGLYSSQGIGEYIRDIICGYTNHTDSFSSIQKELFIYAAELNTSQVRVFGTHGEHLTYELVDAPISKCVEISCAIPVFFKPVYLPQTDKYYVDGGVIKSLHLQNLIDRINYVRADHKTPAIILTFFPFVPPVFPAGSDYAKLSVLDLLSFSLKMTYLEKFQTALRSYRHEEENNIYIQIFRPSRRSVTARTHPLQDISRQQVAHLNYEGETAVYRSFLNDYERLQRIFLNAGISIAPKEEIAMLLKTCRSYYRIDSTDDYLEVVDSVDTQPSSKRKRA